MRRAIVLGLIVVMTMGGVLYAVRRPLLTAAGRALIVQDPLRPVDAIVVLSGSLPDRIMEAVDLYHAGLAPRIILTQEGLPPGLAELRRRGGNMVERYEQNLDIARQLGVPEEAITVVRTPAWSTQTEAEAVVDQLYADGVDSILLVTSKAHARRSALTYRDLVGDRIDIISCPSRYDNFAPDGWWQRRPFARRLLIEYLKLVNYLFVDRWRGRILPPSS